MVLKRSVCFVSTPDLVCCLTRKKTVEVGTIAEISLEALRVSGGS